MNEINRSQKIMHSISFLAHAPELHVPSKNDNSNPEVQQVESNSVNKKPKNEMPQISSPNAEIPEKTITDKKVINVLDLAQVNTLYTTTWRNRFFTIISCSFFAIFNEAVFI